MATWIMTLIHGHPSRRPDFPSQVLPAPNAPAQAQFGCQTRVAPTFVLKYNIRKRTKEGLAAAKAKGKLLGRPKGALGTSRLDGREQDIRALLGKDVSKASIAKILDVSRSALYHFIQTRKIVPD